MVQREREREKNARQTMDCKTLKTNYSFIGLVFLTLPMKHGPNGRKKSGDSVQPYDHKCPCASRTRTEKLISSSQTRLAVGVDCLCVSVQPCHARDNSANEQIELEYGM